MKASGNKWKQVETKDQTVAEEVSNEEVKEIETRICYHDVGRFISDNRIPSTCFGTQHQQSLGTQNRKSRLFADENTRLWSEFLVNKSKCKLFDAQNYLPPGWEGVGGLKVLHDRPSHLSRCYSPLLASATASMGGAPVPMSGIVKVGESENKWKQVKNQIKWGQMESWRKRSQAGADGNIALM